MIRSMIITGLLVLGGATSTAQDFRKVVDIVDEMETSLRQMIAKEQTDRRTDIAGLRLEIDQLRGNQRGAISADTTMSATGAEMALDHINHRLGLIETRADKMNTELAQLTKALSLLVVELKKTTSERTAGAPIQH